ncbi:DUF559 domain-containing protein [Nocardioides sp. KIGAM211]|uniref:DUF559 domain-containing protein n=1 Tax=Nocardioides luti TaxID=2761101 RepID=A0A7X0RK92_9ACTN|nr:DUF559 domain-containing protein [Nocardioides luti]MBB6629871.1 DUF559 domain-containing protein [Nocardioides luti]
MDPVAALTQLGGVAGTRAVLALTTRRRLRTALRHGEVVRVARGGYALPAADEARVLAAELAGVVALRSAALHHGWAVKTVPPVPEVAIGARRRIAAERRVGVRVLWLDLRPEDVVDGVTSPLRTCLDCARRLPFDEALAVVDSALRSGRVTRAGLDALADSVRGAGAAAVRRVLEAADGRAANPFESVLRGACVEAGLGVVPQQRIALATGEVRPDLVCRGRRVVLEADSWTWHTGKEAHTRDCARYNALVLAGWRVLRFTWEQVMLQPAYVRWVLDELMRPGRQEEVGTAYDVPA